MAGPSTIQTRWKLWTAVGVAALALGACSPGSEGGEGAAKPGQSGEAGESPAPAPPPAPAATGGGEQGEAGAADAYAGLEGAARTGLRLQHLKGFLLIADRALRDGQGDAGVVLAQQGLLEVADPAPGELGGLDFGALRAALEGGDPGKVSAALRAALAAIDKAASSPDAERVRRMLALTRGLYGEVNSPEGVDPIEYQHSLGAALAAADALGKLAAAKPGPAAQRAVAEMDGLVKLWPALTAPDRPAPASAVNAAAARVELALSGVR
ncbi:MAG: hypothetical protein ACOYJ6_07255 [Caulobacterales bacterium]|jgi:hypothetical protein